MLPFDLSPGAALWIAAASLGAAFVRGYSGFGFAALIVAAAGLVTNPLHFVPVVVLADVVLSAQQARDIRRHVDWRRVATLFAGCLAGVPIGVWALTRTDPDIARAAISLYILAMCALLVTGRTLHRSAGDAAHVGTGVISGIANGAAVGGLPVAAFFAAQPIPAAIFRATLIAYFTLLDLWTLPLLWAQGLITRDTLVAAALCLPLMILGVHLGSRRFLNAAPEGFRRFAILLLASLAVLGLLRSLV
jgi:uncharacterized membrane protein YfcA